MTTSPPVPPDDAQWESSAKLKPELIPSELQNDDWSQYTAVIASLTTVRRQILAALVENMGSEDKRTECQIADDLGINRRTIQRARGNPQFQQALAVIVRDNLRGLHDKIVGGIFDHGEKDWNAYKFLLQYDGSYVQSQRNLNVNATVGANQGAPGSPQAAIQATIERFMSVGYDKQSFLDLISKQWDQLKEEGL